MDNVSQEELNRHYENTLLDHEWDDTRKKLALMVLREIQPVYPISIRYLDRVIRDPKTKEVTRTAVGQVDGETWIDRIHVGLRYFKWEAGLEASVRDFKLPWNRTKHLLRVSHLIGIKFISDMQIASVPRGDRVFMIADPQFPIVKRGPGVAHDLDPNHFTFFIEFRMAFPDAPQESAVAQAQEEANRPAPPKGLVDQQGRPLES